MAAGETPLVPKIKLELSGLRSSKCKAKGSSLEPKTLYSVYVGNLPLSMEKRQVEKLFVKFGTIGEVWTNPVDQEMEYTYGFVRYTAEDNAQKAVDEMDGHVICGRKLQVSWSRYPVFPVNGGSARHCRESRSRARSSTIARSEDQPFQEALLSVFEQAYIESHGEGAPDLEMCKAWNALMSDFRHEPNALLPAVCVDECRLCLDLDNLDVEEQPRIREVRPACWRSAGTSTMDTDKPKAVNNVEQTEQPADANDNHEASGEESEIHTSGELCQNGYNPDNKAQTFPSERGTDSEDDNRATKLIEGLFETNSSHKRAGATAVGEETHADPQPRVVGQKTHSSPQGPTATAVDLEKHASPQQPGVTGVGQETHVSPQGPGVLNTDRETNVSPWQAAMTVSQETHTSPPRPGVTGVGRGFQSSMFVSQLRAVGRASNTSPSSVNTSPSSLTGFSPPRLSLGRGAILQKLLAKEHLPSIGEPASAKVVNGEPHSSNDRGFGSGDKSADVDEKSTVCYDKAKSFFDSISYEAPHRASANFSVDKRTAWQEQRKLNMKTFGADSTDYRNRNHVFEKQGGFSGRGGMAFGGCGRGDVSGQNKQT